MGHTIPTTDSSSRSLRRASSSLSGIRLTTTRSSRAHRKSRSALAVPSKNICRVQALKLAGKPLSERFFSSLPWPSTLLFTLVRSSALSLSLSIYSNSTQYPTGAVDKPKQKSNYATYVNHLQTIVDDEKSVTVLHVPFSPSEDPSPALGANSKVGATEAAFFYFPSTLTRSDRDAVMSSVNKMRPVLERSEALAVYDGWALEEAVPNPGPHASEGEKSQVYVNLVGWADVEAHMRFQGSEDFQQNIHHMLSIKEMRHTENYHARLNVV